jgi:hypothetical protein
MHQRGLTFKINYDKLISTLCIMSEFCVLNSEPKQCLFSFFYYFLNVLTVYINPYFKLCD